VAVQKSWLNGPQCAINKERPVQRPFTTVGLIFALLFVNAINACAACSTSAQDLSTDECCRPSHCSKPGHHSSNHHAPIPGSPAQIPADQHCAMSDASPVTALVTEEFRLPALDNASVADFVAPATPVSIGFSNLVGSGRTQHLPTPDLCLLNSVFTI
jgi:hypothetical protein